MSFFEKTKIAYYSSVADQNLKTAFEVARNRDSVSAWDRRLLEANRATDLRVVNHCSRIAWGKAIAGQFSDRFTEASSDPDGDPVFLVTLCDTACISGVHDRNVEVGRFISQLRAGLRGLDYVGALEPAYYSHVALGANVMLTTFISWHLHVVVWGMSRGQLKSRVQALNNSGNYRPIAEGLAGVDCRRITDGEVAATVGYILKPPADDYRVAKRSDLFDDLLLVGYSQKPDQLRPGERINLFHAMKHLSLDQLAFAGGEGVAMLSGAKKSLASKSEV